MTGCVNSKLIELFVEGRAEGLDGHLLQGKKNILTKKAGGGEPLEYRNDTSP
jgi:hypothetical protein